MIDDPQLTSPICSSATDASRNGIAEGRSLELRSS
jgi:hypothetical protein